MKELFDRHSARLTDAEDRRVWQGLHDAVKGRRPFWKRWGFPVSALATVTAAVVVVAVVNQGDHSPVKEELASRGPDPSPDTRFRADEVEQPDSKRAYVRDGAGRIVQGQATAKPWEGTEEQPAERKLAPQPVQVEMMAANEPAAESEVRARKSRATGTSGVIRGLVTTDRGEPLSFANVILAGTRMGALSDSAGRFTIENVPPGQYTLEISHLGRDPVERQITVREGEELAQNVDLHEAQFAGNMRSVTVIRDADREQEPIRGGRSEEVERSAAPSGEKKDENEGMWGKVKGTWSAAPVPGKESASTPPDASGITETLGDEITLMTLGDAAGPRLRVDDIRAASPQPGSPIAAGGTHVVNGRKFDAMFFEHYGVNPFVDPEDDPFATFAVDVDNASYALTRSYLNRGVLPPKEAVRVEEFVNSFNHHYAAPSDVMLADSRRAASQHGTFAIHLDAASSPFGKDLVLVRVGLKGREIPVENRKPANLTFVVDVSGSMAREDRLELVKRALHLLLDQLTDEDQVALVVYGSNARTILEPTSLRHRREIERAIDRLQPEGATNAETGLRVGYTLAERAYDRNCINRVVLCSDGVANVGQTGADDILSVIKQRAGEGIYMTAVGFGMGNYNDVLMEKLADKGEGNYYYVDTLDEARKVFVENLTGTLQTIARQVKTQVEFDPETVRRYRLLGYENRDVADKDFRNDTVDAGEVGAGHEVTALFELKLAKGARGGELATVRIRYEDPDTKRVTEEARTLRRDDVERRFESADPSFRMDAAVAEFAEILRHSYWAKDGDLRHVLGMARDASRELGRPDDIEQLVRLVDQAWRLWPKQNPGDWNVRPVWDPDDDGE